MLMTKFFIVGDFHYMRPDPYSFFKFTKEYLNLFNKESLKCPRPFLN